MVKRYVLRRNPITGGHYMAEDDATSGKPLFVKDEDYTALAERCERLEADAMRYQWLKMESPPGTPIELFAKMHQALDLVRAHELFCTPWNGWDQTIDDAMGGDK